MKKIIVLIITLSMLLVMSVTASAHDNHRNNNHRHDNHKKYHRTHHGDRDYERHLPFRWHDRFHSIHNNHRMERIHHHEWNNRFPGLRAYRSNGHHGFWHHGRYVTDAMFFFNSNDELVSIGYMHDGVFIHFRSDHDVYEHHDSFFLAWWNG